jgi:hypothetical protein
MKIGGAGLLLLLTAILAAPVLSKRPSLPGQAGHLCVGDRAASLCLKNGWEVGTVAGAWDGSLLVATRTNPERVSQIDALYQEVLGRPADLEGLRTYAHALDQGWSVAEVREAIAESVEAEHRIRAIYREVLAREADHEGLTTYRDMLRKGWELREVRNALSDSDEARQRQSYNEII